ncbi:MAG: hypothetical protein M5R40_15260 [Anaerolineae bacterium]|nr:hypothetical protein [Anaerolineae bacterium]
MDEAAPPRRRRDRRYWLNLLRFGVAAVIVATLLTSYVFLPMLAAHVDAHPGGRRPVCCVTPADSGLDYEDVTFTTVGGLTVAGWYLPARNGAAVTAAHGLGNNRLELLPQAAALAEAGFGVLLFDQIAHGESGATRPRSRVTTCSRRWTTCCAGRRSSRTASARWAFRGAARPRSRPPPALEAIRAIVVEGPAAVTLDDMPYPANLMGWLRAPAGIAYFATRRAMAVDAPMSTTEAAAALAPRPLLFIAGAGLEHEQLAVRQYFAAAGEPKALWEVPEAGHGQVWRARPEAYAARLTDFFSAALLGAE